MLEEDACDFLFSVPPEQLFLDELSEFDNIDDIDSILSSDFSPVSLPFDQGTFLNNKYQQSRCKYDNFYDLRIRYFKSLLHV